MVRRVEGRGGWPEGPTGGATVRRQGARLGQASEEIGVVASMGGRRSQVREKKMAREGKKKKGEKREEKERKKKKKGVKRKGRDPFWEVEGRFRKTRKTEEGGCKNAGGGKGKLPGAGLGFGG